jgi:hypothetical protein
MPKTATRARLARYDSGPISGGWKKARIGARKMQKSPGYS